MKIISIISTRDVIGTNKTILFMIFPSLTYLIHKTVK